MASVLFSPNNMTANNSPSPYIASGNGYYPPYDYFKAFDGNTSGGNGWYKDTLPAELVIYTGSDLFYLDYYKIFPYGGNDTVRPVSWSVKGSLEGSDFTVIHTASNQSISYANPYTSPTNLAISTGYKYFKITVSQASGAAGVAIAEMQYYGYTTPQGWTHFSKRNGVAIANVNKILGITKTNFSKVNGITV